MEEHKMNTGEKATNPLHYVSDDVGNQTKQDNAVPNPVKQFFTMDKNIQALTRAIQEQGHSILFGDGRVTITSAGRSRVALNK